MEETKYLRQNQIRLQSLYVWNGLRRNNGADEELLMLFESTAMCYSSANLKIYILSANLLSINLLLYTLHYYNFNSGENS